MSPLNIPITLDGVGLLPSHLDELLNAMIVTHTFPLLLANGASTDCAEGECRLRNWKAGYYLGWTLRLAMCLDCQKVEVRSGWNPGLDPLLVQVGAKTNPDYLMGWYSGARARGRAYL